MCARSSHGSCTYLHLQGRSSRHLPQLGMRAPSLQEKRLGLLAQPLQLQILDRLNTAMAPLVWICAEVNLAPRILLSPVDQPELLPSTSQTKATETLERSSG